VILRRALFHVQQPSGDHAPTADQLTTQSRDRHMVTRATGPQAQPFQFTEHGLVYDIHTKGVQKTNATTHETWKHQINQLTNCHNKYMILIGNHLSLGVSLQNIIAFFLQFGHVAAFFFLLMHACLLRANKRVGHSFIHSVSQSILFPCLSVALVKRISKS